MGYSTGVQRNEIMRERSEGGVIFFLFHYLGKKEGEEAGHWKTEMGRSGARGVVIPIFTQFHLFRPYFFPYLICFIFLPFIRNIYPEIIHRSLYNPLVN